MKRGQFKISFNQQEKKCKIVSSQPFLNHKVQSNCLRTLSFLCPFLNHFLFQGRQQDSDKPTNMPGLEVKL